MRALALALAALSSAGLAISALLLYELEALRELPPFCASGAGALPGVPLDCARVLTSVYARAGPLLLEALAAVWFAVSLAASLALLARPGRNAARFLLLWGLLGAAAVPYLVYVELAVLKAVCVYCTAMHALIAASLALAIALARRAAPLSR